MAECPPLHRHPGGYRGETLCGSCAAFTNIVVTFPINKVLFRQQLFGVRVSEAVRQIQRDGLRNLYMGLLPPLLQKITAVAMMFVLGNDMNDMHEEEIMRCDSSFTISWKTVCLSGLLGALLGMTFYPLNVVKSRAQSQVGGRFLSGRKVLAAILKEREGRVVLLFREVHLNYHRSVLSWGIINAIYELLLKVL